MAKNTQQTTDVDTLVAAITAALGGGQFSTPTAVAEKVAEATTFDPKEFAEDQGFALNRGRVTLNADTLKAAQRVLKSGKPEIVEAGGERNSHLVVFRGEHGVSLHNARKA